MALKHNDQMLLIGEIPVGMCEDYFMNKLNVGMSNVTSLSVALEKRLMIIDALAKKNAKRCDLLDRLNSELLKRTLEQRRVSHELHLFKERIQRKNLVFKAIEETKISSSPNGVKCPQEQIEEVKEEAEQESSNSFVTETEDISEQLLDLSLGTSSIHFDKNKLLYFSVQVPISKQ